ncbi:hypothetical protein IF1G_00059 [Cordyceps javanica]|uniref:Uncharacterized protein n=1 Tax=Cordyceps javanica TaxID=43265 RepID=A0A545VEH3_9HYPO|nr:hypothetical protein IF1G_00059 [Cordyceps javanica]
MAPKRVLVEKHGRHAPAPKGYVAATYDALTSPENASVVRSIAVFGCRRFSLEPLQRISSASVGHLSTPSPSG